MAPRASCSLLESKSASRPGRQQPPLPAGKFLRCGRIKFSHAIQRIRAESHPLPAQQPPDTGHGALDPLDEVVAGIQLEHRVDPLSQKVGMDGPPVPQGEVYAVRPALRLVGEDVLLETRKPQRTGHAPHPGEHIRLANGIQGEQPRQGVPGDPPPRRRAGQFFLRLRHDLLHQ